MHIKIKSLAMALVGFLLLAVLSGCGSAPQGPVAIVNGQPIDKAALDKRVNMAKGEMGDQAKDVPKEMLTALEQQAVDQLIDEVLMKQEVDKLGLTVTDQDVENELNSLKQRMGTQDEFDKALKSANMNLEDVKAMVRSELQMWKLYEKITADVAVSSAEVEAYYQANKDSFKQSKQVRASHILLKTEEEAKAVINQLAQGADFATLAKEKSTDPSAQQNSGDLGFFSEEDMVEPFSKAAFAMKPGETSTAPVKSDFGYHVIRVAEVKPEKVQTFEEVKDKLAVDLPAEKKAKKFEEWFTKIRNEAKIENKLASK